MVNKTFFSYYFHDLFRKTHCFQTWSIFVVNFYLHFLAKNLNITEKTGNSSSLAVLQVSQEIRNFVLCLARLQKCKKLPTIVSIYLFEHSSLSIDKQRFSHYNIKWKPFPIWKCKSSFFLMINSRSNYLSTSLQKAHKYYVM